MSTFEERVGDVSEYFAAPRFKGITRLYSPRQVVEQRGTIASDYPIARRTAEAFYARLRELFSQGKSITTFGPYSPGQAVNTAREYLDARAVPLPPERADLLTRYLAHLPPLWRRQLHLGGGKGQPAPAAAQALLQRLAN